MCFVVVSSQKSFYQQLDSRRWVDMPMVPNITTPYHTVNFHEGAHEDHYYYWGMEQVGVSIAMVGNVFFLETMCLCVLFLYTIYHNNNYFRSPPRFRISRNIYIYIYILYTERTNGDRRWNGRFMLPLYPTKKGRNRNDYHFDSFGSRRGKVMRDVLGGWHTFRTLDTAYHIYIVMSIIMRNIEARVVVKLDNEIGSTLWRKFAKTNEVMKGDRDGTVGWKSRFGSVALYTHLMASCAEPKPLVVRRKWMLLLLVVVLVFQQLPSSINHQQSTYEKATAVPLFARIAKPCQNPGHEDRS